MSYFHSGGASDGSAGVGAVGATAALGTPMRSGSANADAAPMAAADELNFYNFFGDILVAEPDDRAVALQRIHAQLVECAQEEAGGGGAASAAASASACASPGSATAAQRLQTHLPQALRLALTCPLDDIRNTMRQIISDIAALDHERYGKYLSALDFAFQPSSFVPLSECVNPAAPCGSDGDDAATAASASSSEGGCGETRDLLEDLFLASGRVTHMDVLMSAHPSFLALYTGCVHHLMDDRGPLPQPWRCYLAIMAAARHQCDYLIALQQNEFLLMGGDPTWLKGIAHAPKKLQSLAELNALLAHQPWLLTRNHIAALTATSGAGADNWSVAELVHALVILSTFHALCGFVFGMGLRMEVDAMDWQNWDPSKAAAPQPLLRKTSSQDHTAGGAQASTPQAAPAAQVSSPPQAAAKSTVSDGEHLLRLLSSADRHLDARSGNSGNGFNAAAADELGTSPASSEANSRAARPGDFSLGDGISGHGAVGSSSGSSSGSSGGGLGGLTSMLRSTHLDASSPSTKFLLSPSDAPSSVAARMASLKYVNFDVNSKQYSTFFLHDYSWKEHGYALVNRYYQGFAQMLDNEWDLIFSLTYNTVSDQKNVDTTPFRRAIWYFTHRLYGLSHDDFDYNKIPVFLTHSLKLLVRKIACAPETITISDFELKGYNFKPSEKCHIVLLAIEARRQASLLYALHSVMRFMGSTD